jgi:predicted DNA-binding transcriptional regulator AlpA
MHTETSQNAFSIADFCMRHGISRSMFYILLKQGNAPRMLTCGRRRLISAEAAAEWRLTMEARS